MTTIIITTTIITIIITMATMMADPFIIIILISITINLMKKMETEAVVEMVFLNLEMLALSQKNYSRIY